MKIVKHQYCCQNTAQNYADHIIPVPDNFDVSSECLCGLHKNDFIIGLKKLTDIIQEIYADMIQKPAEYGLPIVDDIEYTPFNPKAAESKNSSHRLISLLHTLVQCGELNNGEIVVNIKSFSEACKKLKSIFKISNSSMIFRKLMDFGFTVEGFNGKNFEKKESFILSYIDDGNVIPVLYGYMKNQPVKNPLFSLNYYLSIKPEDRPANNHQMMFAEYLSGEEREFYQRFDECMKSEGFAVGTAHDYRDFSIEYVADLKNEKRIARCYSDFGKLRICLKLHNSGKYSGYIELMPERVKQIFRKESSCRLCREPCRMRLYRSFEGIEYTDCGYWNGFDIQCYSLDDIEYYRQIILFEANVKK